MKSSGASWLSSIEQHTQEEQEANWQQWATESELEGTLKSAVDTAAHLTSGFEQFILGGLEISKITIWFILL